MDAFSFQRLPDLAFREVVQSMEPMDILHATQTSYETRCLMSRNARLPITIDVSCGREQCVSFEFCGSYDQSIRFEVNSLFNGPHYRLYKFGKDQKDWSETSYYDDPWKALGTHWNDKFEGCKTIINFLADTFHVKSVSFSGRFDESFNILKHIVDRKLPIQKIYWDTDDSSDATVRGVLEMATAANEFIFSRPPWKEIQPTRVPEYSMDSICFYGADWITLDGVFALTNCLEVKVDKTKLTATEFNEFLKHLVCNTVRAKKWEISSYERFDMETVLNGIKYDEIAKDHLTEEYTIERHDGVKITVTHELPFGGMGLGGHGRRYALKVNVLDH